MYPYASCARSQKVSRECSGGLVGRVSQLPIQLLRADYGPLSLHQHNDCWCSASADGRDSTGVPSCSAVIETASCDVMCPSSGTSQERLGTSHVSDYTGACSLPEQCSGRAKWGNVSYQGPQQQAIKKDRILMGKRVH